MIEVGLVFVRSLGAPRTEPFFNQLITGLEEVLDGSGASLLVRTVATQTEEVDHYRRWHANGALNAVIVKDVVENDPRLAALSEMGMPFVVLGDVTQISDHRSLIYVDNAQAMKDSLDFLLALGHSHITRIAGPKRFLHTQMRTKTFLDQARASGIRAQIITGDYTEAGGERLTLDLLKTKNPPTAIIYDNDLMACGGMRAADELGVKVPTDLSLIAFDDSVRCQLTVPPLTAVSYDIHEIAVQLGEAALIVASEGGEVCRSAPEPLIVKRGTTAPPPLQPADDRPNTEESMSV